MPSPDGPRLRLARASLGEVGREGVAIDTLDDMETLFQGIDLGDVTVSMTINAPAAMMLAFYVVAAEESGVPADKLGGTIQADILKEYIAQKEWCFPVDPAMRLLGDMMEWSHAQHAALAPGLDLRLPHPRGRERPPRRSSRSRSRTASRTSRSRSRAASTSTTSRRA